MKFVFQGIHKDPKHLKLWKIYDFHMTAICLDSNTKS